MTEQQFIDSLDPDIRLTAISLLALIKLEGGDVEQFIREYTPEDNP